MTVQLYEGDCMDILPTLAAQSIDAIVCDPPYGLSFMGKDWDHGVPGVPFWKAALRVAKPGTYLLAFGGTRTFHRLTVAIEDAGWEIRDCLMWLYGSGFPKSHDIGKAIDKMGVDGLAWRTFSATYAKVVEESRYTHSDIDRLLGVKSSSCYWARLDHRGGLPPRHHWDTVRDLLGLPVEMERLYDEAEREVIGQGWRIDKKQGSVNYGGGTPNGTYDITAPATDAARIWDGWGTALKPAWEPIIMARKPLTGTVAANVLAWGTGGINVDACRIEADNRPLRVLDAKPEANGAVYAGRREAGHGFDGGSKATGTTNLGRWPANLILDEEAARLVDEMTGTLTSNGGKGPHRIQATQKRNERRSAYGDFGASNDAVYGDTGGASRFFYCSKASKRDRDEGLEGMPERSNAEHEGRNQYKNGTPLNGSGQLVNGDGYTRPKANFHPTVKPTSLMRWLVRLVTPPDGVVLDNFCGSGSTGKAAVLEGFNFIGIDKDAEYLEIARRRIGHAQAQMQLPLLEVA